MEEVFICPPYIIKEIEDELKVVMIKLWSVNIDCPKEEYKLIQERRQLSGLLKSL